MEKAIQDDINGLKVLARRASSIGKQSFGDSGHISINKYVRE